MSSSEILDHLRRWNIHEPAVCTLCNEVYWLDRTDSLTPIDFRDDNSLTGASEDAITATALEQLARRGALTSLWPDENRWYISLHACELVSGDSLSGAALKALVKVLERQQRQNEFDGMLGQVFDEVTPEQ